MFHHPGRFLLFIIVSSSFFNFFHTTGRVQWLITGKCAEKLSKTYKSRLQIFWPYTKYKLQTATYKSESGIRVSESCHRRPSCTNRKELKTRHILPLQGLSFWRDGTDIFHYGTPRSSTTIPIISGSEISQPQIMNLKVLLSLLKPFSSMGRLITGSRYIFKAKQVKRLW